MNRKVIGKILGILLILEALFLLPPLVISLLDGTTDATRGIGITIALSLVVGGILYFSCRRSERNFYAREGFLVTGLGWILLSLVGALPFYLSREIPRYIDALFETVSGLTTTGSSILSDVEAMSRGLLFWRSFTHWLGGMGILVFLLAVVSMGKGGGYSVHVLRAESPGPSVSRLVPKTRQTALILYAIYIALTVLDFIFLVCGEMNVFESLCTAFGTAGTGGFGIRNDSLASFSHYTQTVCTVFMALFGINFSMYFLIILRRFRQVLRNEELWVYIFILFGTMTTIAFNIQSMYSSFGEAFHHSAFTVSSIITTTGYGTEDFNTWPQLSRSLLLVLMLIGACAGSTGGGTKIARTILLVKSLSARMKRMLHPRSVKLIRSEGRPVPEDTVQGVYTYMSAYVMIAILSFLVLTIDGFSLETNLTAMISCLNNIGPGLDAVGPTSNFAAFSDLSKVVLMLDMLLGRLEIFPILILFSPRVWRKAN